ncbi:hypothetical protein BD289DRAFT_491583 [Coniella lustricola]|uniref:Uncharacterized protein n=1 Tax=Coniella lustricola TaxID=2025994 RepID=A0A2T2ZYZ5_9PEZI|nr:hypothetical protein BD289DRAFT_491583 [Coniella lustricola]
MSELHSYIAQHPDLAFLSEAVISLETLWPTIRAANQRLKQVHGDKSLAYVRKYLQYGERGGLSTTEVQHDSIIVDVITVISHVVDFHRITRRGTANACFTCDSIERPTNQLGDIQGFCLGFLTAAAIASSQNEAAFRNNVRTILRIAVCIGALVEADAVELLATGVRASDIETLKQKLLARGLSVQTLTNEGRYHRQALHESSVQSLRALFQRDERFQLPSATALLLPLRSNVDGSLITRGSLHDIALDSILLHQCNWYETVSHAVKGSKISVQDIMRVGAETVVPRSLRSIPISGQTANISNGDSPLFDSSSAVAVIGMACRYPEADSLEEFWELLRAGKSAARTVPAERFRASEVIREPKAEAYWGNFLRHPDQFDHRFFGFSGREAKYMDPQQRLILQVAYEALESAGYFGVEASPNRFPEDVGCYLGVGSVDYADNVASHDATAFSVLGTLRAFISGRLSHYFGWSGPSITYDTACSSGAVAIHSAVNALRSGECAMALAGGVNVITSPALFQNLSAASFLSPTGASKAFDAAANGYCRGEGAGLVLLKPLARAMEDGDSILAVITGSAVNQGSNCSPITVPVSSSQSALYQKALSISGTDPSEVTFVEAHGTGTPVGDPIECESVRRTFGGPKRTHELYLGSVKDNIGHTEAASGAAAIIKTILMLQNREIPKQAGFIRLSPKIPPLEMDRIQVPRHTRRWDVPRHIAVVNNYGAAGSNAAIVVEAATSTHSVTVNDGRMQALLSSQLPFFISAKTSESLKAYCKALKDSVSSMQKDKGDSLVLDFAYNLAMKQNRSFQFTQSFTAATVNGLLSELNRIETEPSGLRQLQDSRKPIVLCIGGQNGRTVHLDETLFRSSKPLQQHLNDCEQVCNELDLPSIYPAIFDPAPVDDLVSLHSMLFSLQYASARAWLDSGVKVEAIVGHSFGQLTALVVANALSLQDGLRFVAARARLIQELWGQETGEMLSVQGPRDVVHQLFDRTKTTHPALATEVACYNGPQTVVLAGDKSSIDGVEATAKATIGEFGVKTVRLKNTHAFHSSLVEGILPGLSEVAATLQFRAPAIRIEACSKDEDWNKVIDSETLVQHSRRPVHFYTALQRIESRLGHCVFLEAGSASPVIPMARRALTACNEANSGHIFQSIDLGPPNALDKLAEATCNLWRAGISTQYWPFHHGQKDGFSWINLPPYQFQNTSHWLEYIAPKLAATEPPQAIVSNDVQQRSPLQLLTSIKDTQDGSRTFLINTADEMFAFCTRGHAVLGQSLCPASMYVEMAIRAVRTVSDNSATSTMASRVKDLKISSPLSLASERTLYLRLVSNRDAQHESWQFTVLSRDQPDTASSTKHASGIISLLPSRTYLDGPRMQFIRRVVSQSNQEVLANTREAHVLNGSIVYQVFAQVVDYAPYYRGVQQIVSTEKEAVGIVRVPGAQPAFLKEATCDPLTLDNFLQVAGINVNCLSKRRSEEVFVCTELGELFISDTFLANSGTEGQSYRVCTSFERSGKTTLVNDIFVFDAATGDLAVLFLGAVFQGVAITSLARTLARLNSNVEKATNGKQRAVVSSTHTKSTERIAAAPAKATTMAKSTVQSDVARVLDQVCELFSRVIEIPIEDVKPDISLAAIGVDSLMSSEILNEIKAQFHILLTAEELLGLNDVKSVADFISNTIVSGAPGTAASPQTAQGTATHHDERPTENASVAYESFARARKDFDVISREVEYAEFFARVYPSQKKLVIVYILEAFRDLGCPLTELQAGDRVLDIPVLDKHHKVRRRIFEILEDAEILEQDASGGYTRTSMSLPSGSSSELHQAIVAQFPEHAYEHNLLASTGSKLADCLTGRADPLAILFGSAAARSLMENVYTHAPMFKTATVNLARYLVKIFDNAPAHHTIRVLELGAGTGGTTKHLIESLLTTGRAFEYTFTDISSSLVAAARKKFRQYDFMRYALLDIEKEPEEQFRGQYDLILSSNCIHATKDLTRSCTNIRSCLRPEGVLCLVELTRALFWFDLVFGLLEGWWLAEDGRQHALASEMLWRKHLERSGFRWIDWTEGDSEESKVLRVITASPSDVGQTTTFTETNGEPITVETIAFKHVDGLTLEADIYYPSEQQSNGVETRPVALMIHGGGHVMLSRRDIRPAQTIILLDAGFLPVSIDYRLCPETTLPEGPMTDARDALVWARTVLPKLHLRRPDIRADGDRVVAVGWSTGGHLALSLGFTAGTAGVAPPNASLVFYCPSDYEDPFWRQPNQPFGQHKGDKLRYNLLEGVQDRPIAAYTPPTERRALGGWMSTADPRSRIALHMNWTGRYLEVLLNGLPAASLSAVDELDNDTDPTDLLPFPSREQIQAVSPLAQIEQGKYHVPTFIIHGTKDDLIPWQQAVRTYDALRAQGVTAEIRILDGAVHLFDMYKSYSSDESAKRAIQDGYAMLARSVRQQ